MARNILTLVILNLVLSLVSLGWLARMTFEAPLGKTADAIVLVDSHVDSVENDVADLHTRLSTIESAVEDLEFDGSTADLEERLLM
jgi:hypothetical protein